MRQPTPLWPARLWRDRRGAVAVTAAFSIFAVLGFAAMAIDFGNVFLQTRKLQGDADLAAMAAAGNITKAQAAAAATANANGWQYPVTTTTVIGAYVADPSVAASKRFTVGGTSPNAAQVTLQTKVDLFFGAPFVGSSTINIRRSATAATAQMASFSIGSGLLSVQGGVANSLLSALTGSQVSLSAMDYQALATANIDLLQYSQALQTDVNLKGVSFNKVLSGNISQGEALKVLGNTLSGAGQTQAGSAMQQIAAAAGGASPAELNQLIDLGPYANQDHVGATTGASISVNALDLANSMLELAQGGRQVQLSLGANVPGVTSTTLWLAIGQRPNNSPWLTVNDDGSVTVSTAQARIYLDSQLAPGLLSPLGVQALDTPIYVELASAQAKLSSITCPTASVQEAVNLSVAPSVGQIALGTLDTSQLNNFAAEPTLSPAVLLKTPLFSATASADVNLGGANWQSVAFNQSDIQSGAVKTVSTNNIAQASVASLLGNTSIQVAGLNLGTALTAPLQALLTSVAPGLDSVLNSVTGILGVKLGEADVSVNGVRCNNAALVS